MYVLADGSAKQLFGASGLKYGSTGINMLQVGGCYGTYNQTYPSGIKRMGSLKIINAAIYGSDTELPVTSSAFASYAFPAKMTATASTTAADINNASPAFVVIPIAHVLFIHFCCDRLNASSLPHF